MAEGRNWEGLDGRTNRRRIEGPEEREKGGKKRRRSGNTMRSKEEGNEAENGERERVEDTERDK